MSTRFQADIRRFTDGVEKRLSLILETTAKDLHARVRDITPYRTGRARASWNIKENSSDNVPAPDIGLGGLDATEQDISSANVFYDSLIRSKSDFKISPGANQVHITNTVEYIEDLNNGSSRQAPAGFFQAVVASAPLIAEQSIRKAKKV